MLGHDCSDLGAMTSGAASFGVLAENLGLATVMVCLTVVTHLIGLLALLWVLRHGINRLARREKVIGQGALILLVVLGLAAIHAAEIWQYALAFIATGALGDLETALYFSTVNFSSLGYGDITLGNQWRLFGAIEAANGLILFAWSTAFLLSITRRLRILEHDWLEQRG
jgi:hypothetical protein